MTDDVSPGTRVRGRRPPQGDPVVDRALALLGAFDSNRPYLTLSELSRRTGIPASSALRLAGRLLEWGALERGTDGRFSIGMRLWEVASLTPRSHELRRVALPFMGDLEEVTRQHVLLAVLEGEEALMVERLSSHGAVAALYRPGGRMPLHSTGVGLVLLAFAESGFQEHVLGQPLMHLPEQIPVSPAALRRTLAEIRRDGLATFRRGAPEPIVSVAAPVHDAQGTVVAALSVLVPAENAEPRLLGPAVRTAARGISRGLGAWRAPGTP
ncbi:MULTISPECIES: IclR family transcriptional regulator [unclassified Modestobacter]|uniref:IclR family transcriptional regulator n=1 Tax=unclassified Modestobacter TaxID=2643866 RepID=UPI0022AA93A0|nr:MULTISPECIES: IclR family transcriptional regulator [unclassified Modestobacter]MCZ2826413.1 IclR family transcriptional regulator [Modestobacter sp. VKM Ac-2981]MCZ2852522.1 IclR family transcriptional regulator [Modestobacter sp. VKM Ac-2982]